jgi:hypothetical protein
LNKRRPPAYREFLQAIEREFIAYAKSKPGELNYASSGAGTAPPRGLP